MGIPDHVTCLLQNLYAGQEATVRIRHQMSDWFQIVKEVGIPDHLSSLLRNPCACQEATARTGYGKTDWFQIGKGVCQGCILSPCLFNLNEEYIMRNAGMNEEQAGIKISGRNTNNLRYADDTSRMAESEEELESLE